MLIIGFNVETIEHKNLKFTIWDVGGLHKLRPLWRHYYLNTQGEVRIRDFLEFLLTIPVGSKPSLMLHFGWLFTNKSG